MYIDLLWNLDTVGLQAHQDDGSGTIYGGGGGGGGGSSSSGGWTMADAMQAAVDEMSKTEQGRGYLALLNSQAGFKDKELDQAWRIAQMGEAGATTRSRISAAASTAGARISANASMANQRLQSETQRYGIDTQRLTDQEKIALERELGYGGLGIQSGQLGLDYAKASAGLHGPASFLEEFNFNRGAAGNPDVPVFLQSLMQGGMLPGFVAPAAGQAGPAGYNMGTVLQNLGGAPGATGGAPGSLPNPYSAFISGAKALAQKGFQALPTGSLQKLGPDELAALKDAAEYSQDPSQPAFNWNSLMRSYGAAQPGQGSAAAA